MADDRAEVAAALRAEVEQTIGVAASVPDSTEYSWKQAQEDRGRQLNAFAAPLGEVSGPTPLTQRLVEAAADGARLERIRSLRDTGKSATDHAQAAQSVIRVLRELAEALEEERRDYASITRLVRLAESVERGETT